MKLTLLCVLLLLAGAVSPTPVPGQDMVPVGAADEVVEMAVPVADEVEHEGSGTASPEEVEEEDGDMAEVEEVDEDDDLEGAESTFYRRFHYHTRPRFYRRFRYVYRPRFYVRRYFFHRH